MKALLFVLAIIVVKADAQLAYNPAPEKNLFYNPDNNYNNAPSALSKRKLFQRNTGMIIGLQKGRYTSIELGGEAHWRKISLFKPHVIGATANLEYDFPYNVIGYKAGAWMKRGRINLTYGANVSYFTNFKEGNRFGFGPSVGFRLLGLHLVNGYNFLTKDKTTTEGEAPIEVNTLYMSLRYYFPVHNSFTWDRKTMKKKRLRRKERARKKEERQDKRESGEGKGLFNFLKKDEKDKD